VNVCRGHCSSSHAQRRLTQHTTTGSIPRHTSRGGRSPDSCTSSGTVPQHGHAGRPLGHHPHRDLPVRLGVHLDDSRARDPEKRGRPIFGRRGSPWILDLHKSGSWDPHPHVSRNDTPLHATLRLPSGDHAPQRPSRRPNARSPAATARRLTLKSQTRISHKPLL
jgi:hypothetical protein